MGVGATSTTERPPPYNRAMKALVTGGTGFVGSHLIEQLRARGDDVVALCRPGSNRKLLENIGAEVRYGDLDDSASLEAACAGCDVVYHCAARVEIVGAWDAFQRTTIDGTRRLVSAAGNAGARRFVLVSSCGVYHPRLMAAGQTINEFTESPDPPEWFPYAKAKLAAERVVRELAPPMEWTIIRLGYLYGPRNRTMKSYLEPVMKGGIMTLLGDGSNPMALVYVADAAKAILLAGVTPAAAGKLLIAGGHEHLTQKDYFDAMADGFNLPRVTKKVPYGVAFFFGWLGEYLFKSGPRAAAMRRCAIALTGLPQRINCDYTQKLLNWKPETRFADGMREAFRWYHAEYDRPAGVSTSPVRR